jgi:hypothetical protein
MSVEAEKGARSPVLRSARPSLFPSFGAVLFRKIFFDFRQSDRRLYRRGVDNLADRFRGVLD